MREPILGPGWKPFLLFLSLGLGLTFLVNHYVADPLMRAVAWERDDDPLCQHSKPEALCKPKSWAGNPDPLCLLTDDPGCVPVATDPMGLLTPTERQPRRP